jgi:hypothetical protein
MGAGWGKHVLHQTEVGANAAELNSQAVRLLIVSEVRFVRESLSEILGRGGGILVVGQCAESGQAWNICQEL